MSFLSRRNGGDHRKADAAGREPAPSDHAPPAEQPKGGLFVTDDHPHAGPAAPPRKKVGRKVPTAPYVEVHAPHTPQPWPAVDPAPQPAPRPYAPEPATPPRLRHVSPRPRKAMPAGPVDVPGWLYPGYDGTAQEYARLMRVCDRLTGTASSYSDPRAWPQHELPGTEKAA